MSKHKTKQKWGKAKVMMRTMKEKCVPVGCQEIGRGIKAFDETRTSSKKKRDNDMRGVTDKNKRKTRKGARRGNMSRQGINVYA